MNKDKQQKTTEGLPQPDIAQDVDRQKEIDAGTPPKHRKQVTRENTNSREEVRQQTIAQQGHPK